MYLHFLPSQTTTISSLSIWKHHFQATTNHIRGTNGQNVEIAKIKFPPGILLSRSPLKWDWDIRGRLRKTATEETQLTGQILQILAAFPLLTTLVPNSVLGFLPGPSRRCQGHLTPVWSLRLPKVRHPALEVTYLCKGLGEGSSPGKLPTGQEAAEPEPGLAGENGCLSESRRLRGGPQPETTELERWVWPGGTRAVFQG